MSWVRSGGQASRMRRRRCFSATRSSMGQLAMGSPVSMARRLSVSNGEGLLHGLDRVGADGSGAVAGGVVDVGAADDVEVVAELGLGSCRRSRVRGRARRCRGAGRGRRWRPGPCGSWWRSRGRCGRRRGTRPGSLIRWPPAVSIVIVPRYVVDAGDGGAGAVADAEAAVVLEADRPVAGLVRAFVDDQLRARDLAGADEVGRARPLRSSTSERRTAIMATSSPARRCDHQSATIAVRTSGAVGCRDDPAVAVVLGERDVDVTGAELARGRRVPTAPAGGGSRAARSRRAGR